MGTYQNPTTRQIITTTEDFSNNNFQSGQDLANQGYVPVAPDTKTITPASLNPVKAADFTTPTETTIDNPANIHSDITPTEPLSAPQTDLQSKIDELMGLNLDIAGKSAFQTKQEALQPDLATQKKAEVDLSAQLKTLQADALNIPNQMQLNAEGRGITAGGLAPIETATLRRNSIQANTVGALLAATQGKIAYAQGLVDKAVAAEFDPKEAKQKALTANLDLILKSPNYTNDEKKRAAAQKLIEDQKTADIAQAKVDKKAILDTATEAAKNGADALIIKQISEAKTPAEALQLASGYYQSKDRVDLENKLALAGYNYVKTPAERDSLRAQGYDILVQSGRTYAKSPEPIKITGGGGGGVITPEEIANGIIPTITGKPRNDTQNMALGYAQRMQDANSVIEDLGGKFTGGLNIITGNQYFPNILKSADRQKFEQAQRNFVNSVLRKESGAAISPSEFDSAAKQYFPQPGDSQAVIDQKTSNRKQVINTLLRSSNTAVNIEENNNSYDDYLKAIQ